MEFSRSRSASYARSSSLPQSPKEPKGPPRSLYLGVDVGTGSARAGVFDEEGRLLGVFSSPIQIWKEGNCVEQSSTDIWHAICSAVRGACTKSAAAPADIKGIGFAATCSLVALGADDSPVTVSWSGDTRRNVIVWIDHRAVEQADRINATHSPVLQFVGGALSPEMQPPKLLWVKENLPQTWAVAFRWMDLSDWLTYRATGDDTRSLCTAVCKWTYMGHAHLEQMDSEDSAAMQACGWDDVFWQEVGLGDLVEGRYTKIGRNVAFPGHPLGLGLTLLAAQVALEGSAAVHMGELGLLEGTPVGTALIDAHAGGVGVLESISAGIAQRLKRPVPSSNATAFTGASHEVTPESSVSEDSSITSEIVDDMKVSPEPGAKHVHFDDELGTASIENSSEGDTLDPNEALCRRMVLVCGTSTCHMALSQNKVFIPGVWGPYWSAMVPDFWLTEAGQSATGALLDYLVDNHVAAPTLANRAASQKITIFELLNKILEKLASDPAVPFEAALTKSLHVLPDFHGNRSPRADPRAKGMISGLSLDGSETNLAVLYLAAVQSIAYGTRQIVEHCNAHGLQIDTLLACGGLAKNKLFLEAHADIVGCPVILPRENESILLGSAILGAVAAKRFVSVHEAMRALNAPGLIVEPSLDPKLKKYHDAKYAIFQSLYEQQRSYRSAMAEALS